LEGDNGMVSEEKEVQTSREKKEVQTSPE